MDNLTIPPTELEVAHAIKCCGTIGAEMIRRLAFERDILKGRRDEYYGTAMESSDDGISVLVAPAWVTRMEKCTEETGYHCSAFEAHVIAKTWRDFIKELGALKERRKEIEQAVISGASSIIDNWDDWDGEAQQAAQQDQDERSWRHVMLTHIVSRLWRELGFSMEDK